MPTGNNNCRKSICLSRPPRHNLLAMQTQTNDIYTKQTLLLWGLKQVFSSIMMGLRSKFDFEWATTQTTVISDIRRELFSSFAGFLFLSELSDCSTYKTQVLSCFYISCKNLGQRGLLSINFTFWSVIFQPMVFLFVWVKYKWKFMRDCCKLSFPPPPLGCAYYAWVAHFACPNGELACMLSHLFHKHFFSACWSM